jgi:hypothetical protein
MLIDSGSKSLKARRMEVIKRDFATAGARILHD